MKILFIEPCYKNFGGYFRAINIAKSMSLKNIKIDLLIPSNKRLFLSIKKEKINKNLTLYELPRFYINFFFQGRLLRGFIGLFFSLLGKYDLIHAFMPIEFESNIPAFFLKLLGKKVIMDWDDMFENGQFKNNFLIHSYIKFCEKFFPKYIKNYTVTTDTLEKITKKRGATNVLTIINGVDYHQVKIIDKKSAQTILKLNPKYKYILTFGNTLSPQRAKPLFSFIQKLIDINHNIYIITNFDPNHLINEYDLNHIINKEAISHIINVGYITDLSTYLSAVDATMLLIPPGLLEKTSFPIRIGTYLSAESIIITNDTGTYVNRILKQYKCAIIDKDLDKLAHLTSNILNNPNKHIKLKLNTKIAKKELSWKNITMSLIHYYQNL